MRYVWFLIFLIFVAIIGVFAFENSDPVPINYLDQSLSVQSIHLPMSVLIGGIYVLGMLIKGVFLTSSVSFEGRDDFHNWLLLICGAVLALIGSFTLLGQRRA